MAHISTDPALMQNNLIGCLIGLARATEGNAHLLNLQTQSVILEGLCATPEDPAFSQEAASRILEQIDAEKRRLIPGCYLCASPCGRNNDYDLRQLQKADPQVREIKTLLLLHLRDVAALARQAVSLGFHSDTAFHYLLKALYAIGAEDWSVEALRALIPEARNAAQVYHSRLKLTEQDHFKP